jgi:hypothetical protein
MFDATSQIRILVLEGGEPNSPISASFQVASLEPRSATSVGRTLQWEAISYTWDGQKPSKEIQVNGQGLRVTENVFRILRALRCGTERKYLWIDALCIDQDNDTEK